MNKVSKAILDNTVSSKNQLQEKQYITFEGSDKSGIKILFVGNSITRHAPKSEIGWDNDWGMAASKKENDYVHILIERIQSIRPDCQFCIAQVAEWETAFWNDISVLPKYKSAAEFEADIIIFRIAENVTETSCRLNDFLTHYQKFLVYLNPNGKSKVILTTSFWDNPLPNLGIRETAKKFNYSIVELGHLGEQDKMKALGLFEHSGIAAHPGDLGMKTIADEIWEKLRHYI